MESILITLGLGIVFGVIGTITVIKKFNKKKSASKVPGYHIYSFIENMKSVGELVVFKVFTKEVVTKAEHWLGDFGKRYLTWLMSNMKMAMVFQFEIDFRYDLRSTSFAVAGGENGRFVITMPQCVYDISIKDMKIYDEQSGRLFDWVLPPILSKAFSKDFTEEDKNRLIDEAKLQASSMAEKLIKKLGSEIEKSAWQTFEMIAKSFGAKSVLLDFSKSQLIERSITDISPQAVAEA